MPAIQLARLKLQAAALRESFTRPEAFVRGISAMLNFYADRTHRPGQAGEPPPLIPAYHAPPQVLRHVLLELKPLISKDPESALTLSDALQMQRNLECRWLSAAILGTIPFSHAEQVINKVKDRVAIETEDRLLDASLLMGLSLIRKEGLSEYLNLAGEWMRSENLKENRIGLRALKALLFGTSFQNLPLLYRALTPLLRTAPPALRPEILDLLSALAHRSPKETAYFLHQNLDFPGGPEIAWLSRQVLPDLPLEERERLRTALREANLRQEL